MLNTNYPNISYGSKHFYLPHSISPKKLSKYIKNCALCGETIPRPERTYDHFLPKNLGGKTEFQNGIVCCKNCNQLVKRNFHPIILFNLHPEMKKHLQNYLELPEVKRLVLPPQNHKDQPVYYVNALKAYIKLLLGWNFVK